MWKRRRQRLKKWEGEIESHETKGEEEKDSETAGVFSRLRDMLIIKEETDNEQLKCIKNRTNVSVNNFVFLLRVQPHQTEKFSDTLYKINVVHDDFTHQNHVNIEKVHFYSEKEAFSWCATTTYIQNCVCYTGYKMYQNKDYDISVVGLAHSNGNAIPELLYMYSSLLDHLPEKDEMINLLHVFLDNKYFRKDINEKILQLTFVYLFDAVAEVMKTCVDNETMTEDWSTVDENYLNIMNYPERHAIIDNIEDLGVPVYVSQCARDENGEWQVDISYTITVFLESKFVFPKYVAVKPTEQKVMEKKNKDNESQQMSIPSESSTLVEQSVESLETPIVVSEEENGKIEKLKEENKLVQKSLGKKEEEKDTQVFNERVFSFGVVHDFIAARVFDHYKIRKKCLDMKITSISDKQTMMLGTQRMILDGMDKMSNDVEHLKADVEHLKTDIEHLKTASPGTIWHLNRKLEGNNPEVSNVWINLNGVGEVVYIYQYLRYRVVNAGYDSYDYEVVIKLVEAHGFVKQKSADGKVLHFRAPEKLKCGYSGKEYTVRWKDDCVKIGKSGVVVKYKEVKKVKKARKRLSEKRTRYWALINIDGDTEEEYVKVYFTAFDARAKFIDTMNSMKKESEAVFDESYELESDSESDE